MCKHKRVGPRVSREGSRPVVPSVVWKALEKVAVAKAVATVAK